MKKHSANLFGILSDSWYRILRPTNYKNFIIFVKLGMIFSQQPFLKNCSNQSIERDISMPVEAPIKEFVRQLYYDNYNRLMRYGCSIENDEGLVHDEIQELFVWLLRNPGKLQGIKNPDTYLLMSLRRNIRSTAQRGKIAKNHGKAFQTSKEKEASCRESEIIQSEAREHQRTLLRIKLDELPVRQKEAIYLRFFENLGYDDIAEIFGVSNQIVRNIIFRAIKNLRQKDFHLEVFWLIALSVFLSF
jgi:RNA polymerase sigma factor (sigma-70 family)